MKNSEKQKYLNLSASYSANFFDKKSIPWDGLLEKMPKKLYKFRKFDEYTFDMIKGDYAFLASAEDLDDPFDCLIKHDLKDLYKNCDTSSLSTEIIKFIVDEITSHFEINNINKKDLTKSFKLYLQNCSISKEDLITEIIKKNYLVEQDKKFLIDFINNSQNLINVLVNKKELEKLMNELSKLRGKIGVCSLTTKRDNKVMWSLYSDLYKGYCVEYEQIEVSKFLKNIKPVIYCRKYDNDVIKAFIRYHIEALKRILLKDDRMIKYTDTEFLYIKDLDWSFQDEWRITGKSNFHYKLSARAVYLGYKVEEIKENEMITCAKIKGFSVYKMKDPKETNMIRYEKIF